MRSTSKRKTLSCTFKTLTVHNTAYNNSAQRALYTHKKALQTLMHEQYRREKIESRKQIAKLGFLYIKIGGTERSRRASIKTESSSGVSYPENQRGGYPKSENPYQNCVVRISPPVSLECPSPRPPCCIR